MHELALADAVVAIVCEHADGCRVEKVELKVGHLRQVVPSALSLAFQLVAEGTLAEGAELELVPVAARVACGDCGAETEVEAFPLVCGACGALVVDVVAGEEFFVESLEIVRDPVAAGRS